jgi:hypothetical protein
MTLSIDNLNKPSHKKMKRIADYLLYTALPAINVFFVTLQPVSMEFSLYGIAISTLIITLFKGATKFTAEEPKESIDEFEDKI